MTVILLRHGRSTANTAGVLAGRSADVALDDTGNAQALAVVQRFAALPIKAVVTSPLLRCQQTVAPIAEDRALSPLVEDRLVEVDYGSWTGRELKNLLAEPLWKVVQQHPSAAVFPDGEGLAHVQARAVAAVREHDARLASEHGTDVLWIACTHGDVIKSVLADALGTHLDCFQRIVADPCSASIIRYTDTRPFVLRSNDTGGDLSGLIPPPPHSAEDGASAADAVVGGATGG